MRVISTANFWACLIIQTAIAGSFRGIDAAISTAVAMFILFFIVGKKWP
jgi:hypothetical protein